MTYPQSQTQTGCVGHPYPQSDVPSSTGSRTRSCIWLSFLFPSETGHSSLSSTTRRFVRNTTPPSPVLKQTVGLLGFLLENLVCHEGSAGKNRQLTPLTRGSRGRTRGWFCHGLPADLATLRPPSVPLPAGNVHTLSCGEPEVPRATSFNSYSPRPAKENGKPGESADSQRRRE